MGSRGTWSKSARRSGRVRRGGGRGHGQRWWARCRRHRVQTECGRSKSRAAAALPSGRFRRCAPWRSSWASNSSRARDRARGQHHPADVEAAAGEGAPAPAVPLRGMRRAMAQNMVRAHAEIVPATVTDDADIGGWAEAEDVTIRLVRAIVAGCRAEPALNAHYLGPERGRLLHRQIHLGIAMDTPDGLLVPVLRDVGGRDRGELAPRPRRHEGRRRSTPHPARGAAGPDHHALQLRHVRRPLCPAGGAAAAGRDPGGRAYRPARRGEGRCILPSAAFSPSRSPSIIASSWAARRHGSSRR